MHSTPPYICQLGARILHQQGCTGFHHVQVDISAPGHPCHCGAIIRGDVSESDVRTIPAEPLDMTKQENGESSISPFRGLEFSPLERSIMGVMTDQWQTRVQIAEKCGHTVSSSFSTILANLVDRDYLESGNRGFRLRKYTP